MAGFPDDGKYITASVPDEMRQGVELADVAAPTAVTDIDGQPAQLTRITFPRPDHIPAGPPRILGHLEGSSPETRMPVPGTLQYDFPLFPAVQCRVTFQGEPTADHLDQLADYIAVACKRLREQEGRDAKRDSRITDVRVVGEARKGPGKVKLPRKEQTNAEQS